MENDKLELLIFKVSHENKNAFKELYELTSPKLYAICYQLVQRRNLAEEILQDAFIQIWHNAGTYQSNGGTVLSWMISIVRYRALDKIRYDKVRKEEPLSKLSEEQETKSTIKDYEKDDNIERCIDSLDFNQRQAIHLAYFNGYTHSEVMYHMSSSLGTVKSWIRRGLKNLERCLTL